MTIRISDLNRPQPQETFRINDSHRKIVAEAKAYVKSNLDKNLSLPAVATHVGYSRWHFAKMFRRIQGVALHQFVAATRMNAAATQLLNTDDTVLAIMHRVGYASSGTFSDTFRFYFGEAPARWRAQRRAEAFARQQTESSR